MPDDEATVPFLLSPESRRVAEARAVRFMTEGYLPNTLGNSNIQHWVFSESFLKTHDWQIMTGLMDMYLIAGLLPPPQQRTLFAALTIMNRLWNKRIKVNISPIVSARSINKPQRQA